MSCFIGCFFTKFLQFSYDWVSFPLSWVCSKKATAGALCEASVLSRLRQEQWRDVPVRRRRKEIYVLVRNMRSTAYRLACATVVLEQQERDTNFMWPIVYNYTRLTVRVTWFVKTLLGTDQVLPSDNILLHSYGWLVYFRKRLTVSI